MAYCRDLRELIKLLEGRGKLYRFHEEINKDTELMPFYRVQMRGVPPSGGSQLTRVRILCSP